MALTLSIMGDFGGFFDHETFWRAVASSGAESVTRAGDVVTIHGDPDPAVVAAVAATHTGAPPAPHALEPWVRQWPGSAAHVRWDDRSSMIAKLRQSVELDLHGRVIRIDHLDPVLAAPVDPFGERWAGPVLVREDRVESEAALGPAARVYMFSAFDTDGQVVETWNQADPPYSLHLQTTKGRNRRLRAHDRMVAWVAAGFTAVDPQQGPASGASAAADWGAAHREEIRSFLERADTAGLKLAVQTSLAGAFAVQCGPLGVHLAAPEIDPTSTVRDAVLQSLGTWDA